MVSLCGTPYGMLYGMPYGIPLHHSLRDAFREPLVNPHYGRPSSKVGAWKKRQFVWSFGFVLSRSTLLRWLARGRRAEKKHNFEKLATSLPDRHTAGPIFLKYLKRCLVYSHWLFAETGSPQFLHYRETFPPKSFQLQLQKSGFGKLYSITVSRASIFELIL